MKTNPNELTTLLTKRELMAIEFTKAFISIEYDCTDTCVKYGLSAADKLIEALNKEEQ